MFFVYVLQCDGRHYSGFTADLTRRLEPHNAGLTRSTRNRGPWSLVHQEVHATRTQAMRREKFLKSGQGREELRRILAGNAARPAG